MVTGRSYVRKEGWFVKLICQKLKRAFSIEALKDNKDQWQGKAKEMCRVREKN